MRAKLTNELIALQQQTPEQPYSIVHRLRLAEAYRSLGYPDLAVGDAYKALLLIDEVAEEGEYHDEALETANADYLSEGMKNLGLGQTKQAEGEEGDRVIAWAQKHCSRTAYVKPGLSRSWRMTDY